MRGKPLLLGLKFGKLMAKEMAFRSKGASGKKGAIMREPQDLPKLALGLFPTPCYKLEAVSAKYGRTIYIKRDDLCGVAMGGNKIRKLQFLLADAKNKGCDTVFTTGSAQSNHAMLTAACAARLGMRCVLFLKERGVTERKGNLILDDLYGAEVHFMDTDRYAQIYDKMEQWDERLSQEGHKCCAIPVGGSTPLGSIGYVECVDEIARQCPRVEHIVCAVGSGGTAAGLTLGAKMYLPGVRVTGVAVYDANFEDVVPQMAEESAALLEQPFALEEGDFRMSARVGPGYGIANPQDTPLIEELARMEGILLDPIYTGKAWAGMLDLLRKGHFNGSGPIVFVHTGGISTLFAVELPHESV